VAVDIQEIDPYAPHRKQIRYVVAALQAEKVIVYPTDTVYGLGADVLAREAIRRILHIKGAEEGKLLSFIFNDIKQASRWIHISNSAYKIIRRLIPGPYTFILPAARQTPHPIFKTRKTIGVRIPDCAVARGIVEALGRPMVNSSIPTGPDEVYAEPGRIVADFKDSIDLFLNGGPLPVIQSTIIDFTEETPRVIREGAGDISRFTVPG